MCIDTTVKAAFNLGFHCRVVANACAIKDLELGSATVKADEVHAAFMAALSGVFAEVVQEIKS